MTLPIQWKLQLLDAGLLTSYKSTEAMSPALPPVALVDVAVGVAHGAIAVMHALVHSPSVLLRHN